MKKNLLYALALACSLGFATSCSDDDEPVPSLDVNATYSGESLDLTYSGEKLLGKVVTFNSNYGEPATLELRGELDLSSLLPSTKETPVVSMAPGVIPGEVTTTIANVPLTLDGTKYVFEGTDSQNGRTATYKGSVEKGKLTLSIENEMPDNEMLGTWNLGSTSVLSLVWNSDKGILLPGSSEEWPTSSLAQLVPMMVDPMIKGALKTISLNKDGNIVANYLKSGSWVDSPLNIAYYYMKDDKMYVQLNIQVMLAVINQTKADGGMGDIAQFLPLLSEGVPVSYKVEGNKARVTLEKDILLPVLSFILSNDAITELILSKVPSDMQALVGALLPQFPEVLKATKDMSVSLNLEK